MVILCQHAGLLHVRVSGACDGLLWEYNTHDVSKVTTSTVGNHPLNHNELLWILE